MSGANTGDKIQQDLRRSPDGVVLYLEGKTDLHALPALLGRPALVGEVEDTAELDGVLLRAVGGADNVRGRVESASKLKLGRIFGVVDGDGATHAALRSRFDPPFVGPIFAWKGYCIENLIAKTGWPERWGAAPGWPSELKKYGPYVATNRVGTAIREILGDLGVGKFLDPVLNVQMIHPTEVVSGLAQGKHRIQEFDVEERFRRELSDFEAAADRDLDEVHALLNGKWLSNHLAPTLTKQSVADCRYYWIEHARSVGGSVEVREWWDRALKAAT